MKKVEGEANKCRWSTLRDQESIGKCLSSVRNVVGDGKRVPEEIRLKIEPEEPSKSNDHLGECRTERENYETVVALLSIGRRSQVSTWRKNVGHGEMPKMIIEIYSPGRLLFSQLKYHEAEHNRT